MVFSIEAAPAIADVVGVLSLVTGSSLFAAWISLVFSIEAALAIADVVGVKLLVAVLTGFVDAMGRASCLTSRVEAASVMDLVGVRPSGAASLVVLDSGLLAVWSSVVVPVSHAAAQSAIAAVSALCEPLACPVTRSVLSMAVCILFAVLAVRSFLEALRVRAIAEVCVVDSSVVDSSVVESRVVGDSEPERKIEKLGR